MHEIYLKLKKDNNDKVIIIKNGEFYYTYDKDSYIINYFFKYKIINTNDKEYTCFPKNSLNNIIKLLNSKCIGYVIYDKFVIDISFGDSEIYHSILLRYYNNKLKEDLINSICSILSKKDIKDLKKIYNGIN